MACTIFEVPIGSTLVYVEQDTPDQNLLGKIRLKLVLKKIRRLTRFKFGNILKLEL